MTAPPDPGAWGVIDGFRDATGVWRNASSETVRSLLEVLGADRERPSDAGAPLVVRSGHGRRLDRPVEVVLEDGASLGVSRRLPPDLPLGYHRLRGDDGERALIVSPGVCPLPARRLWGFAVQLYALRSAASWGMGDLGDLGELARWAAGELGAGVLMLNPLHADVPVTPQQPSPYFPSSRRYTNPLYLRIEDIAGAGADPALVQLAATGRALSAGDRIDRDAVLRLKLEALTRLWPGHRDAQPQPDDDLRDFAVHCVLAERHGRFWRTWPEPLRAPHSDAVRRAARAHADRVGFFAWLQRLCDAQVAAAASPLTVVHDLAVGIDPDGADAWCWPEVVARGVSAGAPPDEFNLDGQDWGLAPFDPWRLRAAGYRPFAQTLRAALRGGGIRIDHVMGLFRLYWIPAGRSPADGAYVRHPSADLLDIVALECARADAFAVGEDLGTVEAPMRTALRARNVLSYRLLWFEGRHPQRWPRRALAAVTTHDLPTVAGLWTGSDLLDQRRAGLRPNPEALEAIAARVGRRCGLRRDAPVAEVIEAVHRVLATAPCPVTTANLSDALGVAERPNMPGTVDTWPNWRLPLPVGLEAIRRDPGVRRVAAALARPSIRPGSG